MLYQRFYTSFPSVFPYTLAELRPHDTSDSQFYSFPRFVNHIDDGAISALNRYYGQILPPGRILDICSSWVSHIPVDTNKQVIGLGMNAAELAKNEILSEWVVHDLNEDPDFQSALPTGTSESGDKFDAIICNVSIDYLSRPLEVMQTIRSVLKDGGFAHMAISNRCFPTKVSTTSETI